VANSGSDSVSILINLSNTTGVVNYSLTSLPEVFRISQNYPNPFNAQTIIQYSLPVTSDVTINIYDLLGHKVETLVKAKQQAGYHHAIWQSDGFPSGVYFYNIQAGDYVEIKKMMLLK